MVRATALYIGDVLTSEVWLHKKLILSTLAVSSKSVNIGSYIEDGKIDYRSILADILIWLNCCEIDR